MPNNANVVLHQLTASLHPAAGGLNKPAMSERPPPAIFDRKLYAVRRARAAPAFGAFDFLHRRATSDIVQRLEIVKRDFPRALFYGAGELTSLISETCGVGDVIHADLSRQRLTGAGTRLVYDEEFAPFAPHSFDLIVSVLTLHHVNDLVGALAQMRHALKPDGLMLAVMFGEETLAALRQALYAAETEISGGVSAQNRTIRRRERSRRRLATGRLCAAGGRC
ncbi:MAG: methyltransferase domain-containing protein [Parvularculaceae bacterium]